MRLCLCKFCGGIVEEAPGLWTIRGIFERISVAGGFPCPSPPLNLVVEIEGEIGDPVDPVAVSCALSDEDGGLIAQIDRQITIQPPVEGIPSRQWLSLVFLPGCQIPRPGLYRCDVSVAGLILGGERLVFMAA